MSTARLIVVVGHGPELERDEGAALLLRSLGAEVRTLELWQEPGTRLGRDAGGVRAVIVEAPQRPDLATAALRVLRREPALAECGALAALSPAHVAQLDPASGFDDFVLVPYVPAELYARVRALEWRRSEFVHEERIKIGAMVIDLAAHEVTVDGTPVALTAREFALLVHLGQRRGRVVSRDEALAQVWGARYDGGPRTVDIHVRRLRQKLGDALPLETRRGVGYRLAPPRDHAAASEAADGGMATEEAS